VPGAPNALTAKMIADTGFEAVYVTGAGVTNAYLGVPDLGLITLSELADNLSAMRDVVDVPIIAAGGICDGASMAAAWRSFALTWAAVWMAACSWTFPNSPRILSSSI